MMVEKQKRPCNGDYLRAAFAMDNAKTKWSDLTPEEKQSFEAYARTVRFDNAKGRELMLRAISDLVMKVGLTRIHQVRAVNPLSGLWAERMSLGQYKENISVAMARSQSYMEEGEETNPFRAQPPKVFGDYSQENYKKKFSVQTRRPAYLAAFHNTNEGGTELDMMIGRMVQSLSSALTAEQYVYVRKLIAMAFDDSQPWKALPTQKHILAADLRNPALDVSLAATVQAELRQRITDLEYQTESYNARGISKAVPEGELIGIFHKDAAATLKAKALSFAFNERYLSLGIDMPKLDTFGDGLENAVMLVAEPSTFQVHTQEEVIETEYNPATGEYNHWLRVQEMYAYNPQGACRVFLAPESAAIQANACFTGGLGTQPAETTKETTAS